jgi:hypothetical protein
MATPTPNIVDTVVLLNYFRNSPDWTEQIALYTIGTQHPTFEDPSGSLNTVLEITLLPPNAPGAAFAAAHGPQIEERLFTPFLNKFTGELVCVKHHF